MTKATRTLIISSLASAVLTGCTANNDKYPSLAVRDAELLTGQAAPTKPVEVPTTSAQTFEQLRGFVEQARNAHQQFMAAQPGALRLAQASRNVSMENDTRASALIAIAHLTSLHGQTTLALSDLDQLEFYAATAFDATGDIKAAQILVGEMINEQESALDSLTEEFGR